MSTPTVPRDLQLPPTQRAQSSFREQRRQKLKERLLRGKAQFALEQENQTARGQKVVTCEDQYQEGKQVLKLQTKVADKENIERPTESKNKTIEENCVPLKPTSELTNSEMRNFEADNQDMQLLPIKNDFQSQNMTLSQAFHLKNNNKKKQVTAEKPKQDANRPKKPVLGCYRGQIVQSKIDSFRKPPQVQDKHAATTERNFTTLSKATKPEPANPSSVRAPNMTAASKSTTKSVSTTFKSTLLRPPVRSHNNSQGIVKQGLSRTPARVTVTKGPREKELLQSKTILSVVKTSSSQDVKRKKALSKGVIPEAVPSTESSSNTKLVEKSKTVVQHGYTIARATVDKSFQPKETTEERKALLNEWRPSKGRMLKRPPDSVAAQPEPEGHERPVGSFWTTMAEEDEQRLFTEKVNRTFSECLNLVNKGCSKEEILGTLNDLIENIPDAKKLVKYWICLVRIETITGPIENIMSIYEKAILAGAQPIEELRHTIVEILTMKKQEKINLGENIEEAHSTWEHMLDVKAEDRSAHPQSGQPEVETERPRNALSQDCAHHQDNKTRDPTSEAATPDPGCIIKYNVSSTPCLQSMKKKMQHDKINSTFKELKFLTPVRRSQRIQDKICQLPDMLKDHYPSVSSLEQLSGLGGDVFVCRPNAALCSMFPEMDKAEGQ